MRSGRPGYLIDLLHPDAAMPRPPACTVCDHPVFDAKNHGIALAFCPPAVAAAGSRGNVIVSPYSVSATMTMVDVGAAGQTESQIESVLHLPGNGSAVAPAYATLACGTESDGSSNGNELLIAIPLGAAGLSVQAELRVGPPERLQRRAAAGGLRR